MIRRLFLASCAAVSLLLAPVAARPQALTGSSPLGTTTNNNACAGCVGEYVSASVAIGSAVPLTTATAANVTSITLTPGDWNVSGNIGFSEGASTVAAQQEGAISATSGALGNPPNAGAYASLSATATTGLGGVLPLGTTRLSLASMTTVYLVGFAVFTGSTDAAYGFIGARRAR